MKEGLASEHGICGGKTAWHWGGRLREAAIGGRRAWDVLGQERLEVGGTGRGLADPNMGIGF